MTTREALENLMCHHRIVSAMKGDCFIQVSDTLRHRLNLCAAALAEPKGPCPNKVERDALLAALKGLFAHHRVGKAMRGESEPLVSDTFMDRLQECHRVLLLCERGEK